MEKSSSSNLGDNEEINGNKEELEVVCLKVMLAIDRIVDLHGKVGDAMSKGFWLMSKARYSMGGSNSVSELQYDTSENMIASVKVDLTTSNGSSDKLDAVVCEDNIDGIKEILHKYIKVTSTDNDVITECIKRSAHSLNLVHISSQTIFSAHREAADNNGLQGKLRDGDENKSSEIRRRRGTDSTAGTVATDSSVEQVELSQLALTEPQSTPRSSPPRCDPLKWFGVLVPQTLRQCQQQFASSLPILIEIANAKAELTALVERYKKLMPGL